MIFLILFSTWVFAEKGLVPHAIMKNTGELVQTNCLPPAPLHLKTEKFEIKISEGKLALDDQYKTAVLQSMTHITKISDSPLFKAAIRVEQHRGGRGKRKSCYNYSPGGRVVQLVSGCTKTKDTPYLYAVKHFVHEIGHMVGQADNNYAKYKTAVKEPCHISSYGLNNTNANPRNEEFADVFRAILFDVDAVKKAGGSCVAAADFFDKLLKLKKPVCEPVPTS